MKRLISIVTAIAIMCSLLICSTYATAASETKFKDVKNTDWYAEAVGKLSVLDIVDGMADGSYNPQGEVTRAQFVKMLVQAMEYKKIDSVSFIDMKANSQAKAHWASVYVETALRNGVIIKSEEGDSFYPDVPISREDMIMMICRALKLGPSSGANPYFDMDKPNGYFTKVYEEYLVRGIPVGGKVAFNATGITTRAQASVIVSRLVDYKSDPVAFVEEMARQERIASGTETAEDLEVIKQSEFKKAQSDPNYIMEPQVTVCNREEDFEGMAAAGRLTTELIFTRYAGYLRLENYSDYEKYSPNVQFKLVNVDSGKDLLNTRTELTIPFVSHDTKYESRIDVWESLEDFSVKTKDLGGYVFRYITRDEEKSAKGKWVDVPEYVNKGETLHYKLYLKRGKNTEEYDIVFKVN